MSESVSTNPSGGSSDIYLYKKYSTTDRARSVSETEAEETAGLYISLWSLVSLDQMPETNANLLLRKTDKTDVFHSVCVIVLCYFIFFCFCAA